MRSSAQALLLLPALLFSAGCALGLDEPLSKYLPDAPESWKGITVRLSR